MLRDPMPLPPPPPAPPIVGKAKLYAAAFTVMYALCTIGGLLLVVLGATGTVTSHHHHDAGEQIVQGAVMFVVGAGLAVLSGMAWRAVEQRTKRAWTLNMVLMALGLTSCCCIPFALPLLLQWNKPEVKQWYGA